MHGTQIDQILADENASGRVQWALTDNQGTVRDLIDSTGTIQNHIVYDSFGNVTSQTNPAVDFRFGYTGYGNEPSKNDPFGLETLLCKVSEVVKTQISLCEYFC